MKISLCSWVDWEKHSKPSPRTSTGMRMDTMKIWAQNLLKSRDWGKWKRRMRRKSDDGRTRTIGGFYGDDNWWVMIMKISRFYDNDYEFETYTFYVAALFQSSQAGWVVLIVFLVTSAMPCVSTNYIGRFQSLLDPSMRHVQIWIRESSWYEYRLLPQLYSRFSEGNLGSCLIWQAFHFMSWSNWFQETNGNTT